MTCLVKNDRIKKLAENFSEETEETILNLVGMWQEANNKNIEEYPSVTELSSFIKKTRFTWDRHTSGDHYEVSTKGDKRFSALNATFKEGTTSQTVFSTSRSTSYPQRTRENADWSDITLSLAVDFNTAGERLTKRVAGDKYVSSPLPSDGNTGRLPYNLEAAYSFYAEQIYEELKKKGKTSNIKLNIAGNGIYSLKGFATQEELNDYVTNLLKSLQSLGITISEIRSGGQTGVDEAGIIAAQRLGIPNEVHATSDFKFRDANGKDISDENQFKARFQTTGIASSDRDFSSITENVIEAAEGLGLTINIATMDTVFNTPGITTVEDQQQVDLVFDPVVRRDRVSLIARLFSDEIDTLIEEERESLRRRINNAESSEEVEELQAQLDNLAGEDNRIRIIKKFTPGGIYKRVANVFTSYINLPEEVRIQQELNEINKLRGAEKYSDERKREVAKKRADYKYKEFKKVVDNPNVFKALAEESSSILTFTEGISVDPSYMAAVEVNFNEDNPEGVSEGDINSDDESKEVAVKDGWMVKFRQVSSRESLSQAVRAAIRKIPRLDYRGKYEKDDLGFLRYLDADYAHATLIDALRFMTNSDDMISLLTKLQRTKPWVGQVVKLLQSDEALYSQFYQDFRKDFTNYWIQKTTPRSDGSIKIETVAINKPEGIYYLINSWRDNYESGTILDDNSVYGKNGSISTRNAKIGLELTNRLNNAFNNKDFSERLKLLEQEEVWNSILKLLHMLGISVNPSTLRIALTSAPDSSNSLYSDPVSMLLSTFNVIFNGISKGEVMDKEEDGIVKRGDLINTFGSAYNTIARMLAEVTEDAIESSVMENGKSYYSHVNPNYIGKLIKNLKNVMNDEARFKKFIETEFKNYEWFFKDGHWRNDWLVQLEESQELRNALDHKVLLNFGKKEYSNWDDLDYTLILLNEYWGEPESSRSHIKYAWYHLPIPADSPSAEFIRFRKYTDGDIIDEDGNKKTYKQVILDKLIDLVNQEYDRIMLVRERKRRIKAGDKSISPIDNFDKNGDRFFFIPELNSIKTEDGQSFIDKLAELKESGSTEEFMEFLYTTLEDIVENKFEKTYREWARIGLLEELPNGKYKYLPFQGQSEQNSKITEALDMAKEYLGSSWDSAMESLLEDYRNNRPVNDRAALIILGNIDRAVDNLLDTGGITKDRANKIQRGIRVRNRAKEALREYFWNSELATSQIIQLLTTDLAYYKNYEDFVKRIKEYHAPALRYNTKATYKGERIGRDWERTIYIVDNIIESKGIENIKDILDAKVEKGELSSLDRDFILTKFRKINETDGQAYRSLSSYRAIRGMAGQWTDEMQRAYENFKSGTWNIKDFNIIWQTIKPYVYTQVDKVAGYHKREVPLIDETTGMQKVDANGNPLTTLVDDTSNPIHQKVPVQHKNSEFLLLAMYDLISGSLGKSAKLRAINKFMEDNQIDVVQFISTVKVGGQGAIDLSGANTYDEVMQSLNEATGIGKGMENPDVVHKISYEDYGEQSANPEHAIDAVQLIGTQLRRLISADMSPDIQIKIGNRTLSKKEWLDLYNEINTENILQSFLEVNKIFKNPKEVERALLKEIKGNPRYGKELERACTLDENGNFNIPLFDPVQSQRVQTLLNSIIRNEITKQKIKGGSAVLVSDYGLTDELEIVYEGKGKNKRIKYIECYMPAYSRKFYEPLMNPDTHQLDVSKLPDNLRKLIGYRIPTEDKYSMIPLYIKGFLPQQNGSAIMLPSEITTISGSDFDIDKLYLMIPEFDIIEKYDIKRAWDDFYNDPSNKDIVDEIDSNIGIAFEDYQEKHPESDIDIDDYIYSLQEEGVRKYRFSGTAQDRFKKWFSSRKKNYKLRTPSFVKVEYDLNKAAKDNSLRARNNMLIDLMYGVLTNEDTASKILNPGGFDAQKKTSRIIEILESVTEEQLSEALKNKGIKFNKTVRNRQGGRVYTAPVATYLFDLDLDTLNDLAEELRSEIDPLSPRTQVLMHQRNMTGANLIGIYAVHNVGHAIMQQTRLALDEKNGSFTLNGKKLTSLHEMRGTNNNFITKNNAGFVAASVDNAKDPVLAGLNQNTFTADATMLLSRLGYSPLEIGLLMAQPIIKEISETYFREVRNGISKTAAIDKVISKYKEKAAINRNLSYENYKDNMFYIEDLANYIILSKEATTDRSQTPDLRKIQYYQNQVSVGYLFKRIMNSADALSLLTTVTRADAQSGAAGPTIADTILKIKKVGDLYSQIKRNKKFPLVNADVLIEDLSVTSEDDLREAILNSPLPIIQAFYTLGVRASSDMLRPYFPQFTEPFIYVTEVLAGRSKNGRLDGKTVNNIYNDLFAYIMSKTEFFGNQKLGDRYLSSVDKRREFINGFPKYFKKVITNNEDIANLEFLKRLKTIGTNDKNPVSVLVFKNVGSLSSTLRERFMRDWVSLLYMENPQAQELALNLFRYSYYRNGFAFGPNSFIHLAPTAVRKVIPEYIDTLRSLLTSNDDYKPFIDQYIYNHLDNRQFVPEITDSTTVKFEDEKGNIKDEVEFYIGEDSNEGDRQIIKEEQDIDGVSVPTLFEYIGKRINGRWVYYRLENPDTVNEDTTYTYTYKRIEPLGYKNNFIEYEYGVEASDMQTVIEKNNIDYDPNSDTLAREDDGGIVYSEPQEEIEKDKSYRDSVAQETANAEAYRTVYGESLQQNNGVNNNIRNYSPNENYRDENDDIVCGQNIITTL